MGAVLGGVAKAATGFGLSKLFGGSNKKVQVPQIAPPSINAGGFRGEGGRIRITPERQALTGSLADQFTSQADRLAGLVGPGLENLRNVRLNQVDNAASRAIGNLRDNLSRRRVLGSSFGQDALARAELEAGQQRAQVEAQTFLEGIDLLNQESTIRRQAITSQLDDLNRAADIGLALSGRASAQLQQNQKIQTELAIANARGSGQFFGQNFQPVARAVGNFVGNGFGGGDNTFVGQPSAIGPFGPGTSF